MCAIIIYRENLTTKTRRHEERIVQLCALVSWWLIKKPRRKPGLVEDIRRLFHPVEILLENLPVLHALGFVHERLVDLGFLRVFGRLVDLVENSEAAGERFARELVSREFIRHIVRLGDFVED